MTFVYSFNKYLWWFNKVQEVPQIISVSSGNSQFKTLIVAKNRTARTHESFWAIEEDVHCYLETTLMALVFHSDIKKDKTSHLEPLLETSR